MKELSPVPPDALAVEARDLRKEFVRKDRKRGKRRVPALDGRLARRSHAANASRSSVRTARGSRRSSACSRPCSCPTAGARRVFGYDVVREREGRPAPRQPRLGGGELLQEDVAGREPALRGALLRDDAVARRESRSRRSSGGSASRPTAATSRWRTSRAGCSRRSRSRERCSRRRCCCCSTSRRRVSTRARSSRCRTSSARCGRCTTRRSCSARTT